MLPSTLSQIKKYRNNTEKNKANMKKWIMVFAVLSSVANASDKDEWIYGYRIDPLNDEKTSTTYTFTFQDTIHYASFDCEGAGRVKFQIMSLEDGLLPPSSRLEKEYLFSVSYRVDKKSPKTIKMMSPYDNINEMLIDSSGYNYDDSEKVAKDMLGGSSIYIRAKTWNNSYHDGRIPISSASSYIRKVFSDCGISLEK